MFVSVLDDPPTRPRGDNANTDHEYTVLNNMYVNVSSNNDSPNGGYERLALSVHRQGASSSDYTPLHLTGFNVVSCAETTDNADIDHVYTIPDDP